MWHNVAVGAFLLQSAVAQDPSSLSRTAEASQAQRNLPEEERILDEASDVLRSLGAQIATWGAHYADYVTGVCILYSSIDRQPKTDSLFQSALEAARRQKAPAAVEALLAWKGRDAMRRGRLDEAASELQEALSLGEKERLGGLDDLLIDLSQVQSRLGHVQEAEALLRRKGSLPQGSPARGFPPRYMCESMCPCGDPEIPGREPPSWGWLQGLFEIQQPDKAEEVLRLLVEESSGRSIAERFRRLEDLQEFLWRHRRYAEAAEIRRNLIAVVSSPESPGWGTQCAEEQIRSLAAYYSQDEHVAAADDLIRREIANSARASGAAGIEYVRNVEPRVEAAIGKADYAAAERVLDELGKAAAKSGDKPTRYLLLRSRKAVVDAYLHAEKFDLAKKLVDRQMADTLEWFGRETYYYAGALSLLMDLAMRQKDYATADAWSRGFAALVQLVGDPGFERMGHEWSVQLTAWRKAEGASSSKSPK